MMRPSFKYFVRNVVYSKNAENVPQRSHYMSMLYVCSVFILTYIFDELRGARCDLVHSRRKGNPDLDDRLLRKGNPDLDRLLRQPLYSLALLLVGYIFSDVPCLLDYR